MKKMLRLISVPMLLSSLFLSARPDYAIGGAWTQPKGTQYNRVAFSTFWSTRSYDLNGDVASLSSNGEFQDWNVSWYQEVGLLETFTFITSIPYKYVRYEDDTLVSDTWGAGDLEFGGRVRLLEKPVVIGFQAMMKVPLGYDKDESVPIGNGQIDSELRLLFGRSLYPLPAYAGLEIGYRVRGDEPSDEIRYLAEFGYTFFPRFSARVKLDGTLSAGNGQAETTGLNTTLTNEYDLGKLEVTGSFKVRENLFIEATWTPTLYGENPSHGHTVSLAVATICRPGELLRKIFKE